MATLKTQPYTATECYLVFPTPRRCPPHRRELGSAVLQALKALPELAALGFDPQEILRHRVAAVLDTVPPCARWAVPLAILNDYTILLPLRSTRPGELERYTWEPADDAAIATDLAGAYPVWVGRRGRGEDLLLALEIGEC